MRKSFFAITISLLFFINYNTSAQSDIPQLNKEIINYVESVKGKKVDRGECWDLANQSLQLVGADWDRKFEYGNAVDPKKETIYPGDLIQFKNIKIQYTEGNATYTEFMEQHTAIVYKVLGNGIFEIAHQNTDFSGRKVGISKLNINHIVKGKIFFYRPTKKRNHE